MNCYTRTGRATEYKLAEINAKKRWAKWALKGHQRGKKMNREPGKRT